MTGGEHAAAEHHVDRLVEDAEAPHRRDREGHDLLGLTAYDRPAAVVAVGRDREQHRRQLQALGLRDRAEVDGLDQLGHGRRGRSGGGARR